MTPPAGAAAAPRTDPAPRTAPQRRPPGPRRVSGPARRPAPAATPPLRRLVDHPLLDRLIRGRAWIGIVAFALIGIVTMEVALLKLNAGIGRSAERAAQLQRANSLLSAQVSAFQADNLQQAQATGQGMVYDPAGDVRFLTAGKGDAAAAATAMVAPGRSTPQTSATGGQTSAPAVQTSTAGAQAATQPATSLPGQSSQATAPPVSSSATTGPTTTSTPVSTSPAGGGTAGASTAPALAGSSAAGSSASQQPGGVAGGAVAAPGG
jgi:hypothetical protein